VGGLIPFRDINGKIKFAKRIRLIKHKVRDAINNRYFTEVWVEVLVVGKNRNEEWVEYYPVGKFKQLNPGIKL